MSLRHRKASCKRKAKKSGLDGEQEEVGIKWRYELRGTRSRDQLADQSDGKGGADVVPAAFRYDQASNIRICDQYIMAIRNVTRPVLVLIGRQREGLQHLAYILFIYAGNRDLRVHSFQILPFHMHHSPAPRV